MTPERPAPAQGGVASTLVSCRRVNLTLFRLNLYISILSLQVGS